MQLDLGVVARTLLTAREMANLKGLLRGAWIAAFLCACSSGTEGNGSTTSTTGGGSSNQGQQGGSAGVGGHAGGTDPIGSGGSSGGSSGSGGVGGSGGSSQIANVCPGVDPPAPGYATCRTQSDCPSSFYICMSSPPTGGGVCGGCSRPAMYECSADADCGEKVCLTVQPPDLCCLPDRLCMPRCTAESCAADQVCGESGHCEPRSCSDGYSCAEGNLCAGDRANEDEHDCAPASCSTDGYVCGASTRCAPGLGADPHGCAPIPCSEAGCPVNQVCDPTAPGAGCVAKPCTVDSDCDCGVCAGTSCAPRLGVCASFPV